MGDQSNQRWLWFAVDHHTNTGLAYVFGRRKDVVFKALKARLDPLGIGVVITPMTGALIRVILTLKSMKSASETHTQSNGET